MNARSGTCTPFRPIEEEKLKKMGEQVEDVYFAHRRALVSHSFQSRCFMIGRMPENLRRMLPYLIHRSDRNLIPEPVPVTGDLNHYLSVHGLGSRGSSTVAVYGDGLSQADRGNLKVCEENGFETKHWEDFRDPFLELLSDVEEQASYAPRTTRENILARLHNIRSSIEI